MRAKSFGSSVLLVASVLGCCCGLGKGQTQNCPASQKAPKDIFADTIQRVATSKKNEGDVQSALLEDMVPFVFCFGQGGLASVVENERIDVQTGGSSNNSGSTSVTSKGSVPALFGLAVENGALTQTVSGTTVTLRGNPAGIIEAMAKKNYIKIPAPNDEAAADLRVLRRISFALSFDVSRGSSPNVLTGSRQQLAGYSFRYDIRNHRDPRENRYLASWRTILTDAAGKPPNDPHNPANALHALRKVFKTETDLSQWLGNTANELASTPNANLESVFLKDIDNLRNLLEKHPDVQSAIDNAGRSVGDLVSGVFNTEDSIHRSLVVTFDYTNTRQSNMTGTGTSSTSAQTLGPNPAVVPNLSTFKLIAEKGFQGQILGKSEFTSNVSVTLFDSIPAGSKVGRVRDLQASLQLDVQLPEIQQLGKGTLTFSGLYMNLLEQPLGMPIMVNGQVVNTKGDIELGQAKLTFPVKKGSGVNIPLSFTYASRTELNKEHDIRGNIGVTFDLDSIFAGLKQ